METNKSNKFLIKSKKQMYLVIGAFALVMLLGGVTYAFFNYTRTGAQNIVRTGTINFSSSETGNTVTLNNVFPVSASTIGTANESANDVRTVEITIDGNTTYNGGIEYVLTLDDVNIESNTTPKKEIPLSLNVTVEGLDSKTIGTPSDDYFTERGTNENPSTTALYSILAKETVKQDEQILVGYIPKNVDVKGKVIVKSYIDDSKVLITDTPVGNNAETDGYTNGTDTSGKTVITTTEWNSLNSTPLSFRVRVEANEGIWVENPNKPTLYEIMQNANQGTISDFSKTSQEDGTNGIYETVEGTTPIYYYRGSVDNNVKFGDYCWKAVRTTINGGVKLIYNGEAIGNQCTTQTGTGTMIKSGAAFNTSSNDAKYVGYTYDVNGTETQSNMNSEIFIWYMNSVVENRIDDSMIDTTTYCNDRSYATGSTTNFGAYERLVDNKTPILNCPNASDNYSLKAGFITADEVVYAGGGMQSGPSPSNTTYYLYNDNFYWTGTPAKVVSDNTFSVFNAGMTNVKVDNDYNGIRPVISLIPGSVVTSGTGTPTDPYVVS